MKKIHIYILQKIQKNCHITIIEGMWRNSCKSVYKASLKASH